MMRKIVVIGILLGIGFWAGLQMARDRGFPFMMVRQSPWSIGIFEGSTPFKFHPIKEIKYPVLSAKDVTDVPALFVADPFMIHEGKKWYLFFEVMDRKSQKGEIGTAQSDDGLHWHYQKIVLAEPFHLSYPDVFKSDDNYYMIPETAESNSVRLYKAEHFPEQWKFVATLIKGIDYEDPSVVHFGDYWWLFTSREYNHDTLDLYYSKELTGPWLMHPKSPIVKFNGHHARPGGRVIEYKGHLVRYAQDDIPVYGQRIHAFEITEITPTAYQERESKQNPVVEKGGDGWNVTRMHQVDAHQIGPDQWIACVDGYGTYWEFDWRD